MEKIPKKRGLEGNLAIPEFQSKKPEPEVIIEKEEPKIKLGSEESFGKGWLQIMQEHASEFPEYAKEILGKVSAQKEILKREERALENFRNFWWKTKGLRFDAWNKQRNRSLESLEIKVKTLPNKTPYKTGGKKREGKRLRELGEFLLIKKQKIESLHLSLQNLDNGEPVDEFREETRKILSFDEDADQYFVEENGQKKYLGVGDITSDYAWGIKYVPAGDMIEPAYRKIAKKILINETRRNLENIYNYELITRHPQSTISINQAQTHIESYQQIANKKEASEKEVFSIMGILSEVVVRELISRVSLNKNLPFITSRASSLEDAVYKYDFKIRAYNKNRGVDVDSSEPPKGKPLKVGFQLKTHFKDLGTVITIGKYAKGKKEGVDEVLLLTITTDEFSKSIKRWLKAGKPSGGPEQFLSRDFKIELLKAVTKDLVEISAEEIEKIFPRE